ncbi:hypothetical protein ACFSAV_07515 [Pasteurella oralis]|uniref:Collagen-like protein n=1 Tax=Pasteurella oralis TaxID=1071947 RepID=A0ABW4NUC5_9PAST
MANLNKRLIDFAQAVSEKIFSVLKKIKELEQKIQEIGNTTGQPGERGDDGKSAYQIWLEVGNNGSKQDFIDSLHGKQGIPGERGDNGDNGFTFTPTVSLNGELSWSNNGNLNNPPPINLKGPKGDPGQSINGSDGATFTPILAENGDLSWTNNKGLQNPRTINIRGPAGYQGEISNSYNGNRRNVPVSEYAVGLLHSKMEQLKETKQVWVGNVTQHSTSILELSESILNKTLIFYFQWSQAHSLQQNVDTYTVSVFVGKELINTSGRKYFHAALYVGGWKNCQVELVSANQIRIIDISNMYLKKITAA